MSTTIQTKDRPILFSAPMIRAILDGSKTQTRRMVKVPKVQSVYGDGCPYGKIGDRLFVRECLRMTDRLIYAADGKSVENIPDNAALVTRSHLSSMFMPRWASRITLEITEVRVQRLQEISEEDAKAEGFDQKTCAAAFDEAAGGIELESCCWLENDETGESDPDGEDYCRKCAEQKLKRLGKKWRLCGDGGSAMESDGPAFCAKCGNPIMMSLTQYGIERELRIEDDPEGEEPKYFPVKGVDARIAHMIADGIGDLRDEHMGRLAQIGFSTLWDSINGKRCPWASNPWVWALTFRRIEK